MNVTELEQVAAFIDKVQEAMVEHGVSLADGPYLYVGDDEKWVGRLVTRNDGDDGWHLELELSS